MFLILVKSKIVIIVDFAKVYGIFVIGRSEVFFAKNTLLNLAGRIKNEKCFDIKGKFVDGGYKQKKGKLLISHRYDLIPLLASTPGGF